MAIGVAPIFLWASKTQYIQFNISMFKQTDEETHLSDLKVKVMVHKHLLI